MALEVAKVEAATACLLVAEAAAEDIAIGAGSFPPSDSSVHSSSSPAGLAGISFWLLSSEQSSSESHSQSSSPESSEGTVLAEGEGMVLDEGKGTVLDEGKRMMLDEDKGFGGSESGKAVLVPLTAFEMRAAASSTVSQVRLTPCELTRGRAKQ